MSDETEQFNGPEEMRILHIAEMLVAIRDDLMMPDVFSNREERIDPNSGRKILFPPTREEAFKFVAVAMMDYRAMSVLGGMFLEQQQKIRTVPRYTDNDGVASIVPHEHRKTASALVAGSTVLLTQALHDEAFATIVVQYPAIKEIDLEDLDFLFFSIGELKAKRDSQNETKIQRLEKQAMDLFQAKVDDLKTRHFGGEWVHVKADHSLADRMEARLKRTKKFLGMKTDDDPESLNPD